MKPWQMIKIVLSALWLGVTLAGLIYWTVTLAYPWNPTNLWLVVLYLAFPLWAFVGALRKKERTRAYRATKTVVLVLALIPLLAAHAFSFWVAVSNEDAVFAPDTVFGPYRLSSETDDPASYGKWDDDMSNLFFPAAIPADAEDAAFHYCDIGPVTVFFKDSSATLSFSLPQTSFDDLRAEIRAAHAEQHGEPDPEEADGSTEVYWGWESFAGNMKVTLDLAARCATYELVQYSFAG